MIGKYFERIGLVKSLALVALLGCVGILAVESVGTLASPEPSLSLWIERLFELDLIFQVGVVLALVLVVGIQATRGARARRSATGGT